MYVMKWAPLAVLLQAATMHSSLSSYSILERTDSMSMAFANSLINYWDTFPLRFLPSEALVDLDFFLMALLPIIQYAAVNETSFCDCLDFEVGKTLSAFWPAEGLFDLAIEWRDIMFTSKQMMLQMHGIASMANFFLGPSYKERDFEASFIPIYLHRKEIQNLIRDDVSESVFWERDIKARAAVISLMLFAALLCCFTFVHPSLLDTETIVTPWDNVEIEDPVKMYWIEQNPSKGDFLRVEVPFEEEGFSEFFIAPALPAITPLCDILEMAHNPPGVCVKLMVASQDLLSVGEMYGLTLGDVDDFATAFKSAILCNPVTPSDLSLSFSKIWLSSLDLQKAFDRVLEVLVEIKTIWPRPRSIPRLSAVAYLGPSLQDELMTVDPEHLDGCLAKWEANHLLYFDQLHPKVPFDKNLTIRQFWKLLSQATEPQIALPQLQDYYPNVLVKTKSLRLAYAQIILNIMSKAKMVPLPEQLLPFDDFFFTVMQSATSFTLGLPKAKREDIPQFTESLYRHVKMILTPTWCQTFRSIWSEADLDHLIEEMVFVTIYASHHQLQMEPVDNILSFFTAANDEPLEWDLETLLLLYVNLKPLRQILQTPNTLSEQFFYGWFKRLLESQL